MVPITGTKHYLMAPHPTMPNLDIDYRPLHVENSCISSNKLTTVLTKNYGEPNGITTEKLLVHKQMNFYFRELTCLNSNLFFFSRIFYYEYG
jgi:hypothetical protein